MAQKIRKTRVSWEVEEKSEVVDEALENYFNDQQTIWTFIARAQKTVLPPDRQRVIVGRNGVGIDVIQEFCEKRRERLEAGVPFQVTVEKVEVVSPSRESILASITNEEFFRLLSSKLLSLYELLPPLVAKLGQDQVDKQSTGTTTIQKPSEMKTLELPRARKPKVLLCGFLKGQENIILEKSEHFELDLRFHPLGRQREAPPSCQWCIVMNKVSHAASNKLKKSFGDRIRLVEGIEGAMSELARINSLAGSGVC